MSVDAKVDRAALVRRAMVELVAEHGLHGTSMVAVAERAGVATGTAYVHYDSKDDLVVAAYVEAKSLLGAAGLAALAPTATPRESFLGMLRAMHDHLAADPLQARFLVQIQASPLATRAHDAAMESDEVLASPALASLIRELVDLPLPVLYDIGIGPIIRVAASPDTALSAGQLDELVASCWRAVSCERRPKE